METVIISTPKIKEIISQGNLESFELDGEKVNIGLFDIPDTNFDNYFNPRSVLVRVNAFSCNFRDRSLMHSFNETCKNYTKIIYSPIGSEFAGVVEKVGADVKALKVGDRVMANNSYPFKASGKFGGVLTNFASQRLHMFNEDELIRVPDIMSDEEAAAFSLSAQTAYSMVRKANIQKGDTVFVTSLSSNTSLAIIEALKKYDVNIYATSTQEKVLGKFKNKMGINIVFNLHTMQKELSKFPQIDVVFDPFVDINMNRLSSFLNYGARYVFCGFYQQSNKFNCTSCSNMNILNLYSLCIKKNVSVIGNCLGVSEDLNSAINDYCAGIYHVHIDSIFSGKNIINFFTRTFKEKHIGKVIYKYQ